MKRISLEDILHFKIAYIEKCENCNQMGCDYCNFSGMHPREHSLTRDEMLSLIDELNKNNFINLDRFN